MNVYIYIYTHTHTHTRTHTHIYICTTVASARSYVYLHRYVRIITYKRVILSYTPALLMIIKTPRSILFALEYFLKFSPDNGAIRRVSPRPPPCVHPFALAFFAFGQRWVLGLHAPKNTSALALCVRGSNDSRDPAETSPACASLPPPTHPFLFSPFFRGLAALLTFRWFRSIDYD